MPSHQVSITKGFWLGQTDVTAGAYKRFVVASNRETPDAPDFNNGWANVESRNIQSHGHQSRARRGHIRGFQLRGRQSGADADCALAEQRDGGQRRIHPHSEWHGIRQHLSGEMGRLCAHHDFCERDRDYGPPSTLPTLLKPEHSKSRSPIPRPEGAHPQPPTSWSTR